MADARRATRAVGREVRRPNVRAAAAEAARRAGGSGRERGRGRAHRVPIFRKAPNAVLRRFAVWVSESSPC